MEAFIGSVIMFGGNFAPSQWALCQGQLLSISSNSALFAILGTTFGGNGQTTFQLPNLSSRVPLGTGQGPGLSNYVLGEQGGMETTTLLQSNMPTHTHVAQANVTVATTINALSAPTSRAPNPSGNLLSVGYDPSTTTNMQNYATPGGGTPVTLAPGATTNAVTATVTNGLAGSSIPFENLQPYLAMNFIVCLYGIFPSRN